MKSVGITAAEALSLVADGPTLRVHVVSKQPIIRAGIHSLLAVHADTVTCLEDIDDKADVAIYDVIGLHLDDGGDLVRTVEAHPGRVLALSRALQPGLTARALNLGAVAAIEIGVDAVELLTAIRATSGGQFQDGSGIDRANQRMRAHLLGHDVNLSPRERQILSLIVAGFSNRDITLELHLSINTVKAFIRSAYIKIGATTRAQAVAWGVEHGFPTTPPDALNNER
jgi:DNA-binding NarL/FixJ family response regulator